VEPIFCRTCVIELEYVGIKDKLHCFECPQCQEREYFKDLNVNFPFTDRDYIKRDPYPLGGKISKGINRSIP
jgi:hypothetical protein